MRYLTPGVKNLLILNIGVFVVCLILQYMQIDLEHTLALYYFKSQFFKPLQYFTYMFVHAGFMHLFFNMWGLFMFGTMLESHWGTERFVLYYALCGIGAGLCNSLVIHLEMGGFIDQAQIFLNNPKPEIFATFTQKYPEIFNQNAVAEVLEAWQTSNPSVSIEYVDTIKSQINQIIADRINNSCMVGASGAVFGLLLAFGMMFPNLEMFLMFIPIPIKAKYMVIGYGVLEFLYGIVGASNDNVAHYAHLGGMLVGFILIMIYKQYTKK